MGHQGFMPLRQGRFSIHWLMGIFPGISLQILGTELLRNKNLRSEDRFFLLLPILTLTWRVQWKAVCFSNFTPLCSGQDGVQQHAPRLVNNVVHGFALLLGGGLPSPGLQVNFHYHKQIVLLLYFNLCSLI